jgi:hypothetical protein
LLERVDESRGSLRRFGIYIIWSFYNWHLFQEAFNDFALHAEEKGFSRDENDSGLVQIGLQ